jgi:hypothetical protein
MKDEPIRRAVSSLIPQLSFLPFIPHPCPSSLSFFPVEFHITRAARCSLIHKVAHEVIMGPEPRKA